MVPETAMRPGGEYEKFHTGRGGKGNVYREKDEEREKGEEMEMEKDEGKGDGDGDGGLRERAKHLFGGGGGREG